MYLNAQNEEQVIAHVVKLIKDLKLIRQSENIGINFNGEKELAVRALVYFDVNGKFDVHDLADVIKTIRTDKPLFRDDCPHFDDPQLEFLDSIEAARETSKEKLRNFLQPVALDFGLFARFNARAKWLQDNQIHRPKVETVQEAAKPLTAKEQAAAKAKADVDAIRKEVDDIPGYSPYADSQRKRLHARLNELLGDRNAQKYYDRNKQEWITGFGAVKRLMVDELREKDSPIR